MRIRETSWPCAADERRNYRFDPKREQDEPHKHSNVRTLEGAAACALSIGECAPLAKPGSNVA